MLEDVVKELHSDLIAWAPLIHWGSVLDALNQTGAENHNLSETGEISQKGNLSFRFLRHPSQFMETEPERFCGGSSRIYFL